jgi:phosphoribosylaminoimidazolecarboxamide formyltransferase / IMP cyclohydrolase
MTELRTIKRALISVSDKTGLDELARGLRQFDVDIISTGGTARSLRASGLDVTDVSDVTGFPEMMDGRVKTLHPKVHGAFLALRDNDQHVASMREHDISPIDLVVVNLYPFEATIANEGVSLEEAVENIDIGGPAMIRSASKNWRDVAVITDPADYPGIIAELTENCGSLSLETRQQLAFKAYSRTAAYDTAISEYLGRQMETSDSGLPRSQSIRLAKVSDLRYGENPHQRAALYSSDEGGGIAQAEQLHGKEMSFNNYVDAQAAYELVGDLDQSSVAIIKHTNPSGVGRGANSLEAYGRALSTDPVSAFGGIVAFNTVVDGETARAVIEVFSEVVVAPAYTPEALEVFTTKKNLRILRLPIATKHRSLEYKQISGGFLVQDRDVHELTTADLKIVTERQPSDAELRSMMLAWTVCKHVKSNAIVFANDVQALGVGAGQMNRVDSVRIAAMRAQRFELPLRGSALASDAFFPFRDNVDEAAEFGITAIIQPGGSIKDQESIDAANEHEISMAFTGIRHFKH